MEKYPPYSSIFQKLSFGESQMLDKAFYEEEVKRLTLAFEQQVRMVVMHRLLDFAGEPHAAVVLLLFLEGQDLQCLLRYNFFWHLINIGCLVRGNCLVLYTDACLAWFSGSSTTVYSLLM